MYENKKTLKDINLDNKKVVVRVDFNVPLKDGKVTNDKRIVAALETINYLLSHNCSIICLSHLSRIKSLDDINSGKKSLAPVAKRLQELLPNNKVIFMNENIGENVKNAAANLKAGEILLLENTRYNDVNANNEVVKKESKNNPELAKEWAGLGEVFVNDAFGTAHRAHASNAGIAANIAESCIGFLVEKEIKNISKAIDNPARPYVAILGGAKVSDKLKVINNLVNKADKIIVTGGMVYTFLKAQGLEIGKSICEDEMIPTAKELMAKYGNKLVLTCDSECAPEYADVKPTYMDHTKPFGELMGLDIGPKTIELFNNTLANAKTVVWNGPCGVSEFENFKAGTEAVAKTLKDITAKGCYTLIGGGDSAAAVVALGFKETDYSFVSTGGGACLALIEGSSLVGIDKISEK